MKVSVSLRELPHQIIDAAELGEGFQLKVSVLTAESSINLLVERNKSEKDWFELLALKIYHSVSAVDGTAIEWEAVTGEDTITGFDAMLAIMQQHESLFSKLGVATQELNPVSTVDKKKPK